MKTYKQFLEEKKLNEAPGVWTYVGVIEDVENMRSLKIEEIEKDYWEEELKDKVRNPNDFLESLSEFMEFEMEFDNSGDAKKFVSAVAKKGSFAGFDASGEGGAIATGKSANVIKKAIKKAMEDDDPYY